MSEPNPDHESPSSHEPPAAKRRKVRKGTQSCWECKRRKIRCTFAASRESICDGCKSRRTKCIGQEFCDERTTARRREKVGRLEMLVEQAITTSTGDRSNASCRDRRNVAAVTHCLDDHSITGPKSPGPSRPGLVPSPSWQIRSRDNHSEVSRALIAVWPCQNELDRILSVPVSMSVLLHGVVCRPYSGLLNGDMPSPRDMLKLPPPESHPVLIARRLLLLGTFLQGIPSSSLKDLVGLGSDYRDIESRVVDAARLVTNNDDLVGSLEGIECIMIESMYHNNEGNLRRAWLIGRRAMVLAQVMALHRGSDSPPPTILDIETRDRIHPEHMWFRLVCSDRYLSLMLGLPQGSVENIFATPTALEQCTPIERMERLESVAGGLILQRNSVDLPELSLTHKVDKLLQEAAASMSAQWWLTPHLASITGDDVDAFTETIRAMNQFTHYHLLLQLHLPYILQRSPDRKYDYSKITAVNASRDTLSRFLSLCNSNAATYCRGIDFLAFIASTTLCLAHIDARRHHRTETGDGATVFQFLAHQRLGDRGMMERTLASMEQMAEVGNDVVATKISGMLRHLLAFEADSADGGAYSTSASPGARDEKFHAGSNSSDAGDVLRIYVPYFGTINIERCGHRFPNQATRTRSVPQAPHFDVEVIPSTPTITSYHEREPELQGAWAPVFSPSHFDLPGLPHQATLVAEDQDVPGLVTEMNWLSPGVDMGWLENIIGDTIEPAVPEPEA
ncbi:hypothetical protein P152DRAFT_417899 [Eremomyces bilateralis CBS 781.70]|uniref:Zn(2)-C6 fungal-type domain-containing protein n=1 Tax=Eremomyces bilateralis CBS 781.70 TaxID=1392243 RepID=A0A6G1G1Y0_9PEZI|nr:uncharacterized protein P152DRAFT_417899 [Eremomyces bilateralis CBS 781.70]KAF1811992.1 hypothetical protein P152DRAFT_417899 [Eremomyces bilateralis CBS 781.70]